MEEVWRPIPGYSGYEISSCGKIKTYRYKRKNYIIKSMANNCGYLWTYLRDHEGKKVKWYISRLVAMTFIENPEGFKTVDHIDRNRTNNCVSNLRWADMFTQNNNRTNSRKNS